MNAAHFPMKTRRSTSVTSTTACRALVGTRLLAVGILVSVAFFVVPAAASASPKHAARAQAARAFQVLPSAGWWTDSPFLGVIENGRPSLRGPRIAAASADLTVAVSDAPDPVTAGGSITYTIDVDNAGPDDATSTVLTFTLAAGTTFTSATPGQGTCSQAAGVVTCPLGTVANLGSTSVSVVVATTVGGTAGPATATVASAVPDPTPADATATASTTVTASADLSTAIDDAVTSVAPGTTATFTMRLANAGPSAAAAGVVVVAHGAAGTTPHTTDPGCVVSGTDVTCTTTTPLAAAANKTWQFTLDVPAGFTGTVLDTQASITSSPTADANAANNVATDHDTIVATADLSIAAGASPDPAVAGEDLTYTITVTNAGPSTVSDAVVTDTIPAGTTFKAAQDGGTRSGGVATWTLGPLAANATATVHLVVTVQANRTTDVSNDVAVASAVADPDTTDRSTTVVSKVTEAAADLSIKTTSSGGSVAVGHVVKFVVTVSNDGPADATGVKIKDDLPKGVTFQSADESDGSFSKTSGIWDLGDLAADHDATLRISGTVNSDAGSTLANSATIQAVDQSDPTSSNDDDTVTVEVLGSEVTNTTTTTTGGTTSVSGTETLATTGTDAPVRGVRLAVVLFLLGLTLAIIGRRIERRHAADR
jgi:uncharacterized repeat protein (TIGR01451 family)